MLSVFGFRNPHPFQESHASSALTSAAPPINVFTSGFPGGLAGDLTCGLYAGVLCGLTVALLGGMVGEIVGKVEGGVESCVVGGVSLPPSNRAVH